MRQSTPMRAIRSKCLDCCGGLVSEVRKCPVGDCALYFYRMGRRQEEKCESFEARASWDKFT